jgi:riboflavin kinase/FMN adenylyltransferase
MQHFRSLNEINLKNTWLTIGSFDGVHRGHQAIIRHLKNGAQKEGALTVVLTFFPHPAVVLGKRPAMAYLTSPEERSRLLGELGVDVVITFPFDKDIANFTADEFLREVKQQIDFRHLVVGYDFALGRDRSGNVNQLQELGRKLNYSVEILPAILENEIVVSSSQIRQDLNSGEIEKVNLSLGRYYTIDGTVVHGDGRGKTIGVPTANLMFWSELALPSPGVYACLAEINAKTWKAVTNVGYRPTFNDKTPTLQVETHLLDFHGDLYAQEIRLSFLSRIRDEQRFNKIEDLVSQIQADITHARKILKNK